jgi:hypothetical protein
VLSVLSAPTSFHKLLPSFGNCSYLRPVGPAYFGIINTTKKEAQMTSPRWLARLTVPMLVGAALVTGAASAGASPADDSYLAQLRGAGFTWPPGHEEALIGMAYLICDDLGWGWTPDHIAQHVHANLDQDSVGLGQVGSMVNIAHSTYCANQRCWAPHC